MNAFWKPVLAGLAATLLAACGMLGPNYSRPSGAVINRPSAQGAFVDTAGAKGVSLAPVPADWWKLYDDPLLDRLIRTALASNTDLRLAAAHLSGADDAYDAALNAGGFTYGVNAGVERSQLSAESYLQTEKLPVMNLASGDLGVSYALDLFGKIRRGAEAARDDAQAAEAARDLARIAVVAQVADAYVGVCDSNHELAIARQALAVQQHREAVARQMLVAGRGTATEVTMAKAQVALQRAHLPPLQTGRKAAEYKLAALLGHTPGDLPAGVESCQRAPELKHPLPVGNGMAMLSRRPDVRMAEQQLAAATARIGVAMADLYPQISIGGSVGAIGLASDFGNALTRTWSLGPLISWTLPSRSAHARVRAAKAGAKAALAHFDGVVLNALREVQTALAAYSQDIAQVQSLQAALQSADQVAAQNRELYRAGRSPYLRSLEAEQARIAAASGLAAAQSKMSVDQIRLFLALGGGWQQP